MISLNFTSNNQLFINSTQDIDKNDLNRIFLFLDAHLEEGIQLKLALHSQVKINKELHYELNNYILQNQDKVDISNHFLSLIS